MSSNKFKHQYPESQLSVFSKVKCQSLPMLILSWCVQHWLNHLSSYEEGSQNSLDAFF